MSHNRLAQEKSPYLLQHKTNPVWWYPWGNEAFAQAKKENKLIFLSVGYSTCHWCHVMERDSFEKQDVADVLNQSFIAIKLDREERPDIDSIYMNAVQAINGSGGWPMSVLLMPDGKPFWGGTFIPHDRFIGILNHTSEIWKNEPEKVSQGGEELFGFLKNHGDLPQGGYDAPTEISLLKFFEHYKSHFDPQNGGNQGAPKFPPAYSLLALMRIFRRTDEPLAMQMVEKTLKSMRRGGIYDQLGGGFHRYSVDDHWLIPHFEKMLYDNALLAQCYLQCFRITKNPEYASVAQEIFDYVLRDMTSPQGGFYSAEDADSEDIEGKFYVWPDEELKSILDQKEFKVLSEKFNTTTEGNFQVHKTGDEVAHLHARGQLPPALIGNVLFLKNEEALPNENDNILKSSSEKLFKVRQKRIRPHLDDKILVSWNGLMISALVLGFQTLGDPKLLKAAQGACNFILEKMVDDKGELCRSYREGPSLAKACADDYSNLIEACLDLFESDFDSKWFRHALKLQETQDRLFWDPLKGGYFDGDGQDPLVILRNKTFEDGVVPSANSTAALNLVRLSDFNLDLKFKDKALEILKRAAVLLAQYPQACPKLLQVVDRLTDEAKEIVIVAPEFKDEKVQSFLKSLRENFNPNISVAFKKTSSPQKEEEEPKVPLLSDKSLMTNQTTFYVCRGGACDLPHNDIAGAMSKLVGCKKYGLA